MKLNFTVDTEGLYGEDGIDFANLLSNSLKRQIIIETKEALGSDSFAKFSTLASETIVADIKLRMENFLSEEIVLTNDWGKKTFVGSVDDLIRKRFDDVLLRPVDGSGKTLSGCTSSSRTWIEWAIEQKLNENLKREIQSASETVQRIVTTTINKKITALKDDAIKQQVDAAFVSILKSNAHQSEK